MALDPWFEVASSYSGPGAVRVENAAAGQAVPLVWKTFLLGAQLQGAGMKRFPLEPVSLDGPLHGVRSRAHLRGAGTAVCAPVGVSAQWTSRGAQGLRICAAEQDPDNAWFFDTFHLSVGARYAPLASRPRS